MMDNLIYRQAALDMVNHLTEIYVNNLPPMLNKADIDNNLRLLPSADVQPVVRCRDCKWFHNIGCAIKIVDESDKPHEDDFCSFGERKDGEQHESLDCVRYRIL